MYRVFFLDTLSDLRNGSVVFQAPIVEAALAFALELHRISNVPHRVSVLDSSTPDRETLALIKEDTPSDAAKK